MNYADNTKVYAASSKIEKALQWAINIANDNSHGYSQSNRWGPDYDCSSFVISALKAAGIDTGNATYTRNMRSNLTAHGFKWIPWSSISNASNLQRGDILLNEAHHTEFYLGNNKDVASHGYYGHTETGDQTGREICVSSYYYYPWDGVLRYVGKDSTDDNHNPKANLESVTGGTGKINVTGWTFDYDDAGASLAVHVYIGGPAGQEGCDSAQIYADKVRSDVNTVFGVGNNHGFNNDIYTYKSGWQDVYVYAINRGQGSNAFIGSKRVYITPDTSRPVISDVKITDVDGTGYTVSCKVTDNVNIDRVQFPTWTSNNGQDDLKNNWQNDSLYTGKRNGDTFTYRVNVSDHNKESGEYITHIYAYDSAGNYTSAATSANVPQRRLYAKTWFSDSKMGDKTQWSTTGSMYYLCYMLYDSDTGRKTTQLDNINYSVKETIYNPDGSVRHTFTYDKSTDNWIGATLNKEGVYKANVDITINGKTNTLDTDINIVSHNPIGAFESAGGGNKSFSIKGWAFDPDVCKENVDIYAYVGGNADSGAERHKITAARYRSDVNDNSSYSGIGGYHGFEETIKTEKTGKQSIYVYAVNKGSGENTLLGIKQVNITGDPPHVHNYKATVTKEPTYTSTGIRLYSCSCGKSYTETIPVKECHHISTVVKNVKEATCTEAGYTGDTYCNDCKKVVAYGEKTAAKGHTNTKTINVKEATCTEAGYTGDTYCNDCKKVVAYGEKTAAKGHTNTKTINVKEATCTEAGYTGDTYCNDCKKVVAYGEKTAAKGHTNTKTINVKEATCTEAGYTGDTYCNDCKKIVAYGEKTAAKGHKYSSEWTIDKEATITEEGQKSHHCLDCDAITDVTVIDKISSNDNNKTEDGKEDNKDNIDKGEDNKSDNIVTDSNISGLRQADDGNWYLYDNGKINTEYTGLYCDENVGWWLVREGRIDFDYNDLWYDENVGWWKISGGTIDFGYTGLYDSPSCGWWLIGYGTVAFDYNDLWYDENVGWWKISGGTIDFGYTGLYASPSCGWWLIGCGTVAFDYNDLWYDENVGWWKISGGTIDFDYTGLYDSPSCGWWLIGCGTVAFDYNELWYDENVGWWKISGGTIDFGYTGLYASPNYGWWLINGGTIAFDYNGLWNDENYGVWEISGGTINFGYTG